MSDSNRLERAVSACDWKRLKSLVQAGLVEDFSDFDYDDFGLIFSVIWSQDAGAEDMALWWLEHGYPPEIHGGKRHTGILHAAACAGMPRLIEKALSLSFSWLSVDDVDYDGHTALWHAADAGQTECVKTLLRLGANPHGFDGGENPLPDHLYDTALHVAANAEIAELLLDAGASFSILCDPCEFMPYPFDPQFRLAHEGLSPVTTAIALGHMDVARFLLDRGAELPAQALRFLALGKGKSKAEDALELVNLGLSPDGEPGKEPLRIAARNGNAKFCRILLEMGAKPLPEALIDAVKSGDIESVGLFLEKGIGDEAKALRLAEKRREQKIVDLIFEAHPDLVNARFLGAIEGCDFRTAWSLLKSGVDLNLRDNSGKTPLIALFAIDRRTDLYRFMRNDPERYKGEWNCTRKRWLPKIDDFDNLPRQDFNYNRPDDWNRLFDLSEDDGLALASELIRKGADPRLKDDMGRTALWHACAMTWTKAIPFLVKMGLDLNERDKNGDSPFDAGCLCGEPLTIRAMIGTGKARVDAKDANGDTALIKCARLCLANKRSGCSSAIVTQVEDYGADPDLKNKKGESARSLIGEDKDLRWMLDFIERHKQRGTPET